MGDIWLSDVDASKLLLESAASFCESRKAHEVGTEVFPGK
jgi:hypothetical protein